MPELSKIRELKRLADDVGATLVEAKDTNGNHIRATFDYGGRTVSLVCANTTSDNRRSHLNNRAALRRKIREAQ